MQILLRDEIATLAVAAQLASLFPAGLVIFLTGPLGAGKTCFSRGFIQALGYNGPVKSPTYTLVESYATSAYTIYHFDLYRIHDPAELEFIGLDQYFTPGVSCLIEWPERGQGVLPPADVELQLSYADQGRLLTITATDALAPVLKQLPKICTSL